MHSKILFMTTIIALLPACSHGPAVQDFPDTASARDEVTKLDSDMAAAIGNQVNVLAPTSFKKAEDFLGEAKHDLDKQKDGKDTLHAVAQGRAYLNRSLAVATVAHANIEDVIVARQQAITAGAPSMRGKDFRDADDRLRDLSKNIENNELSEAAEKRSKLQLTYLDLELQSIKQARLGQARNTIAQAIKDGAKEFAPRTLAIAEKSVQDTDAYITANRHETDEISSRSRSRSAHCS